MFLRFCTVTPLRLCAVTPLFLVPVSLQPFLHQILLPDRILKLFAGFLLPFLCSHNPDSSPHRIAPETVSYPVHCQIQIYLFGGIVEHIELLDSSDHMAEPDPDKPDEHAALVKLCKELFCYIRQDMVERGIWYPFLQGVRIEVRVSYFHCDARRELLLFPELIGDLFDHACQQLVQPCQVGGVFFKSMLGAYRFLFEVAYDRSVVNTVCSFPDLYPVFTHKLFKHLRRYISQSIYGCNTHRAKRVISLLAYHWDLAY